MKRTLQRLVTGRASVIRAGPVALVLLFSFPLSWAWGQATQSAEAPGGAVGGVARLPGDLEIRSGNSAERVWAEVSGTLQFPFDAVTQALSDPAAWCDFLLLHLNTKACVDGSSDGSPFLVLYSGRKYYEAPEDAFRLDYRFTADRTEGLFRVRMDAAKGPLSTRDHRIEVVAAPGPGGTAARVRCSYVPSTLSRAGMSLYLATLGAGKEGFSRVEDPPTGKEKPVNGVRGIIERNAVRYYLALEAFLQTRDVPPADRFEARLGTWFDLADRYPPLREMARQEYVDTKEREQANQLALQRALDAGGPDKLP